MNILTQDFLEYECLISHKSRAADYHIHNFCELYLLIEGELHFFIHESCYHMTPGSLLLINDLEIHKVVNLSSTEPHKRIIFHIPWTFFGKYSTEATKLQSCFQDRALGDRNLIKLTEPQMTYFLKHFELMEDTRKSGSFGSELLIDTYVIQLLIMVNNLFLDTTPSDSSAHPYPMRIRHIISYIDEYITEKLTLEQIAEHLNNDKYYICHTFKKETGTTIFQYIQCKRIALAKMLLAEGKSVTEACYQSGFGDYTNFITSFRKVTGYTPKKFKDLHGMK